MANNFIEQDNKNKLKKSLDFGVDQKKEIKWTEPVLDDTHKNDNKNPFLSVSTKKESQAQKSQKSQKTKKKAKILSEKNQQSFLEKFFSGFKKKEADHFKEQKKTLSEHQENINREKENKNGDVSKDKKNYKDIGTVVKENLEKNKIEISDGHTLKTNLMDGGPTILVDWKKNFLFLALGLFLVVLIIGTLYSFFWFKKQNESLAGEELDREIKTIEMQIEKERAGLFNIDKLQKKLLISKSILDRHIYWTNFFEFLEDNTLENVYYLGGISGNASGEYSFQALTDNYKNISEQLMVLRNNDLVLEAEVSKGSLEEKEKKQEESILEQQIAFDLSLKLSSDIFHK